MVEVIENPFCIELDEKRIINKLYSEIKEIAESEDEYIMTQNIFSAIRTFYLHMEEKISFNISIPEESDVSQLTKAIGIKLEMDQENYLEKLCEYCRILCEVLGMKLIVLFNLRSFLNDEEMMMLLEMVVAREWNLLLLESSERSILKNVKRVILDKDLCEIF